MQRINVGLIILVLCAMVALPAFAQNPNPGVIPPNAKPFGKSYGEWSAAWWQWGYSVPCTDASCNDHPFIDEDGENCDAEQSGNVWFLTGAFSDEDVETPENEVSRSCTVPVGKAIFFPIVNVECDSIPAEPPSVFFCDNEADCRECAASIIEGTNPYFPAEVNTDNLEVTIDGRQLVNLDVYRFQSPFFTFTVPSGDNILGVPGGGEFVSASDGYYIMLTPLPVGEHNINFKGSFTDPITGELIFGLDVTYSLTVAPRN